MLRFVRPRSPDRPTGLEVEAFARANTVRFDALDREGELHDTEPPASEPPGCELQDSELHDRELRDSAPPSTARAAYTEETVHSSELLLEPYEANAADDTPVTPRSHWMALIPPPLPHEDS